MDKILKNLRKEKEVELELLSSSLYSYRELLGVSIAYKSALKSSLEINLKHVIVTLLNTLSLLIEPSLILVGSIIRKYYVKRTLLVCSYYVTISPSNCIRANPD